MSKKIRRIKRADIYELVAARVNEYLDNGLYPNQFEYTDADGKEHIAYTKIEAASLKKYRITRSLVKRNTMTVPYSVTFRGMQDQLRDELDKMKQNGEVFWEGEYWVVIRLLAELNYRAIYEVVKGARLGQEYLKDISKKCDTVAKWNTPIFNFPVVQDSFKRKSIRVKTLSGTLSVNFNTDKLDSRKQSNSIAPNFIHSIDSTVLFSTIDNFGKKDIGIIHDCFLVHANDWRNIQSSFRTAYIDVMKEQPLIMVGEQLDLEKDIKIPEFGDLNLNDVYDSRYIIS